VEIARATEPISNKNMLIDDRLLKPQDYVETHISYRESGL